MATPDDRPLTFRVKVLGFVLVMVAIGGISAALGVIGAVLFDPDIKQPVNALTWAFFALFLAIGGIALWSLFRLRPWPGKGEPVSSSTRRTNNLFAWSGLISVPGALALLYGTFDKGQPFAIFSNSPIAAWVALVAIASWLVSMTVGWLWYFASDEHERDAYDAASVAGAGFFTVVAPVWWLATRAGLAPPPDAMALWIATMVLITAVWFWRRYR